MSVRVGVGEAQGANRWAAELATGGQSAPEPTSQPREAPDVATGSPALLSGGCATAGAGTRVLVGEFWKSRDVATKLLANHGATPTADSAVARLSAPRTDPTKTFLQQAGRGQYGEALETLNGLSMSNLLDSLSQLGDEQAATLRASAAERRDLDVNRLLWAFEVEATSRLGARAPGDLERTGQVQEAARFLGRRFASERAAAGVRLAITAGSDIGRLLWACFQEGVTDAAHISYLLATVEHETARFATLSEIGNVSYFTRLYDVTSTDPRRRAAAVRNGNTTRGDGARYRGRGYVQTTWRSGYAKVDRHFGTNSVADPELLTRDRDLAARVAVKGMIEGWITGKSLGRYGSEASFDYVNARRTVNGTDNAERIANVARSYRQLFRP